jgi:YesN/AraC family two-component response regulator
MPYNILLVDDDSCFREEINQAFDEYHIIEASNGNEAIKLISEPNEIDLVMLDVRLPNERGTDLLKRIKTLNPDIGIIMITGYGSKEVVVEALRGDADEYLEKPLDIKQAKEVIAKVLKAKGVQGMADGGDTKSKIERIKQYIKRNYHKKVTLFDVANSVCLSPKYLSRFFKQETGENFNQYRLRVKVEKAKEFLKNTSNTIEQISDKMGYQNIESFIRVFKKFTNHTPTTYRRNNR